MRDGLVISAVAASAYVLAEFTGFTDYALQFAKDHPQYDLDDILIVTFVLSFALIVYGYRRIGDLAREIGARRDAEAEAQRLARHDPLTGLPNRRHFDEKLNELLEPDSGAHPIALLMLDLDGFKAVNDAYGHPAGDRALVAFTERVSAALRPGTVFARLGGDEFGIIAIKIANRDGPAALARRIMAAVADPIDVDGRNMSIGAGIGIAIEPDTAAEPEQLVRRADLALYRAKAQGRAHTCFFEPDMDAHVERRIRLERSLRAAIAADGIVPHYQPLVSLDGNRIIGFETLARWTHEGEVIEPTEFIALAEESGQISKLSDNLLRRACRDALEWPDDMTLSFNISPLQLRDPLLGLRILAILGETGLRPQRLELELTESALVDHIDVAQRVIDQLRGAGVRIALDDFGTGYATLSQLLSLHLDKIKIDRSFVQRLGQDQESLVIVRAVIGLAKGFGLTTTAEGVETSDQLACLKANGCAEGQGYLFGKALPASEARALLASKRPLAAVA